MFFTHFQQKEQKHQGHQQQIPLQLFNVPRKTKTVCTTASSPKNIRCHKCGELNSCAFNRRHPPREQQSGLALLQTREGKQVEDNLTDVSQKGLGLEISIRALRSRSLKVGDRVHVICNWNPGLFKGEHFIVQNIRNQKVGIRKLAEGE